MFPIYVSYNINYRYRKNIPQHTLFTGVINRGWRIPARFMIPGILQRNPPNELVKTMVSKLVGGLEHDWIMTGL
jgi:hypothetical protein